MAYWNREAPITQEKPIFGSVENIESTTSVHVEKANIGMNSEGKQYVEAGLFLSRVGNANRFLPRDQVTAPVTTGSANVEINMPEVFLVGDVLYHLEPVASVALTSTWAADDTLTVILGENSATVTAVGASTDDIITAAVASLNVSNLATEFGYRFEADTANDYILIYSSGDVPRVAVASNTAGDGAAAVQAQFVADPVLVGTIQSIDHANKTLTLAANAAAARGVGSRIGVLVDKVYGLHAHPVSFEFRPAADLNAVHGATKIYRVSLPYIDKSLEMHFPKLIIQ